MGAVVFADMRSSVCTVNWCPAAKDVMSRTRKPRPNAEPRERIMVAVRDEGRTSIGQASLIDNTAKAERIVAALIEAGVEPDAVRALRAKELPLRVSHRWSVELVHKPQESPDAQEGTTPYPATEPIRSFFRKGARLLDEITPDSPFQLRLDRLLWLGLWAASLVVLGMSLMASLSRGDSRQFVVGPNASSERSLQAPGAALDSNSVPGSPPSCATDGSRECQCNDFATQPQAQSYYEQHPPSSGHDVDPDRDGVVCEWLPGTPPSAGN